MEFSECESKSKVEESKCNRFLPEVHVAAYCIQMTISTTHASLPHMYMSSSHTYMSHICSFNIQIGPVSPTFSCNYWGGEGVNGIGYLWVHEDVVDSPPGVPSN